MNEETDNVEKTTGQSLQLSALLSAIDAGFDIQIKSQAKRMENKEGVRDWYVRFVWFVEGEIKEECDWEGFETADECLADMLDKLRGR